LLWPGHRAREVAGTASTSPSAAWAGDRSAAAFTAVAADGRAYAAWGAQFLSEGGDVGPAFHQVAVRPAGAARFLRAQLLDRAPPGSGVDPPELVLGPTPTVAWSRFEGMTARVRVAVADSTGRFGAMQELSSPGADDRLGDLAASTDGRRLAVWETGGDPSRVRAAVAPPGGRFGPPEDVSAGGNAFFPRAALDRRTGAATVVWLDSIGGLPGMGATLQASRRDP